MLYDTVEEYTEAINDVKEGIKRLLKAGEESENDSGGSRRRMKDTNLTTQRKHLRFLTKERSRLINGGGSITSTPGW